MKVDIWSDYACPFCYIGKREFEKALQQFAGKENVEVTYRSFELDPHFSNEAQASAVQLLAQKFGMSEQQAKEMMGQVAARAQEVDLAYNFEEMVPANTFDAHRLSHYAKTVQAANEVTEKLLRAHFIEAKDLDDHQTLLQIGESCGLDREELTALLQGDRFADDVRRDEAFAQQLQIQAVPFFVFNDTYGVSGAQPAAIFSDVLQKASEDSLSAEGKEASTTEACREDHC
ncbi:DSBA oxidoreductase [Fictibacillus macauensis ZFHKF-1]|uniref:DSBA oxidoreductase n=1 Tax=Fictibacillus macauensis ZFHKF-1 TaxID=1196324 RepID=I8AIM5_9BACL|nr:DsbA family oxidoreductase [Fictibacillus macauensis]EIT85577.1 DSBA oxidoreductase [Fictibacillus macauensis ZFHKF-1]